MFQPESNRLTPRILVINTDALVCEQLERLYTQSAYYIVGILRYGNSALEKLGRGETDLIVTDIQLPDVEGIKLIEQIRESHSDVPVIVVTGQNDIEVAIKVLKLGVSDYIVKPFSAGAIQESTRLALEKAQIFTELRHMRRTFEENHEFLGMLSKTPEMFRVFETIRMVSNMDVTVLVEGETGTGKELVARAIHDRSRRQTEPFVTINCAGLPETLLESELFGYERGAFTGADHARAGMVELAHGGTLFLDEIESMPLSMQAKLLRVLEDRKVQRLGGNRTHQVDMRVIAASNVPVRDLVARGGMRSDFYYRINVVPIRLMPLRQRRGDIPLLVENFLRKHPFALQRGISGVSRKAMSQLMRYTWPGNIRELQNVLEKSAVLSRSSIIERVDLGDGPAAVHAVGEQNLKGLPFSQWIREQEKNYLMSQLKAFEGRIDLTAKSSGMGTRTLFRKMRLYGLDKNKFRRHKSEEPYTESGTLLPEEISSSFSRRAS